MTQATADLPETASVEQSEEQFDADLLAGYATDESPSDSTATPDREDAASAPPETETPKAFTEETTPETIDPLTAALRRLDGIEATHKKHVDDVFGRVGSLEQVLKAQARTPVGERVQVKIEDFGEFGTEYPEFAEAQLKVINKALSALEMTGLSPEFTSGLIKDAGTAAETAAQARLERYRQKACKEELDDMHPGWETTIGLPEKDVAQGGILPDTEYRRWLKTQPKEYADRVLNSFSAVVIGRSLDKFADHQKAQQKSKPVQPSISLSRREQQLRSAVPARTAGVTPRQKKEMSEDEAMQAAYEGRL